MSDERPIDKPLIVPMAGLVPKRKPGSMFEGELKSALRQALAERDAYRAALKVAADDLDKAANQFEAMRQSQEVGYTVPISINPGRFAEKAARARAVLAGDHDQGAQT